MLKMNRRFGSIVLAGIIMLMVAGCKQGPLLDHTVRKIGDSPIPAPAGQSQCLKYGESDLRDYPDETVVDPGQKFTKVWTLQNDCNVSTKEMHAVKIAGDVNGPTEFLLPDIASGNSGKLTQEFTAPSKRGVYSALYRVLNKDNQLVSGFWVDIGVR